jgi:hypothetical protein
MKDHQYSTFQAYKPESTITIVSLNMSLGCMCSVESISSGMTLTGSLRHFGRMGGLAPAHSLSSLAVDRDFTLVGWRNGFPIFQSLESIVLKDNWVGLESELAC